jgi:adenylate kinase
MKNLFLIIGAPGSGKTTDAEIIAEEDENIAHYSTGELLRAEVASGSELGAIIGKRMSAGELVRVEVALDTIVKAINSSTCNTILIDGYPRSVEQMMGLDEVLKREKNITLKAVIEVIVSEETAMNRVLGRNRGDDDNIEVFKNRMSVYTKPLKYIQEFYEAKNILYKISGENDIKNVVKEMKKLIDSKTSV